MFNSQRNKIVSASCQDVQLKTRSTVVNRCNWRLQIRDNLRIHKKGITHRSKSIFSSQQDQSFVFMTSRKRFHLKTLEPFYVYLETCVNRLQKPHSFYFLSKYFKLYFSRGNHAKYYKIFVLTKWSCSHLSSANLTIVTVDNGCKKRWRRRKCCCRLFVHQKVYLFAFVYHSI